MTATTLGGDDVQVQDWAIALGGLLGGGGLVEGVRVLLGRRTQRVDNLAKLEAIATGIAEKATAAADVRVEKVEREFAAHKLAAEQDAARRAVAAAAHAEWDHMVAVELRNLGASVPPPPPLEGVAL